MSSVTATDSGGVRTLTICRPEVKNALSREVIDTLLASLREAGLTGGGGGGVLTGAAPGYRIAHAPIPAARGDQGVPADHHCRRQRSGGRRWLLAGHGLRPC